MAIMEEVVISISMKMTLGHSNDYDVCNPIIKHLMTNNMAIILISQKIKIGDSLCKPINTSHFMLTFC